MQLYELTASAQEDIKQIARYTITKWGKQKSLHYASLLDQRFREIAARTAYSRSLLKNYPHVMVNRCEHHYIFYVHPEGKPPQIIAVLHERMEMLTRLKDRLD